MSTETAALLAEVRQLRAELVAVRGELESLDRGIVATGGTADLALAWARALGAALAGAYEVTGHALPAEVASLAARRARLTVHHGGAS